MKMRWKLLGAVALIGILSIPVCWLTPKGPKVDEDGIRDAQESRGLGDVYKRQVILP